MSIKLNTKYLQDFIAPHEMENIKESAMLAAKTLSDRSGAGNDFLGWVDLPTNYDKEEFERIKKAAAKIRSNSDVLIVIGIGGSYLGARAAIELLRSPLYNNLKKDTPEIYYAGNNISPTYLNEIISLCEGRDFSVNVISKSGTTTEPALAFRIFREMVEKKYGKEGGDRVQILRDQTRRGHRKTFKGVRRRVRVRQRYGERRRCGQTLRLRRARHRAPLRGL